MFSKVFIPFIILVVSSCSNQSIKYSSFDPYEYSNVSPEQLNKIELKAQCIRPELGFNKSGEPYKQKNKVVFIYQGGSKETTNDIYNKEEKHIWSSFVLPEIISSIIGKDNMTINNKNYIIDQIAIDNTRVNSKQECDLIKKEFSKLLKVAKNNIKKEYYTALSKREAWNAERKEKWAKQKALDAYYQTPAGQMELARQQMARQHQEIMEQQQRMMEQQQRMMAAQAQAQRSRDMDNWMNSVIQQSSSMPNYNQNYQLQNINRSLNQINSTLDSMTPRQPGIGPRWNNVY